MIPSNRRPLIQGMNAMISFCRIAKMELSEQEKAQSRLPNAPETDKDAELQKIEDNNSYNEFQHIRAEMERIFFSTEETRYEPFNKEEPVE